MQRIVVDVRGLEPPEPLERVLTELGSLPAGGELLVLIHREPRPLYRILARNGYRHETTLTADGIYQIRIWPREAAR